ncbi:acyltransferase family protein [Lachnospiraceae bacterium 54-53]
MEEKKKVRLPFWDILKGIGILSIVFGHSQNLGVVVRAVYYYHLALFFFISGYLYDEERYGDKPFDFFARRLKNLWTPYVCYGGLFVLLHNLLSENLLFPSEPYGKKDMLYAMANTLFLYCPEAPSGAMWFVPVMLAAGTGFSVIIWFSRNYLPGQARPWAVAVLCMTAGLFGMELNSWGLFLNYHFQTALLVIPVYYGGYILRAGKVSVEKYTTWYGSAACGALLWYFLAFTDESVELSVNAVPGGLNFYVITAAGIYICCYAAKCLQKIPRAGRAAALLGRYSFDIMALHFLVFKAVDRVYGAMLSESPGNQGGFPYSYPELHVIYLISGAAVPVLAAMGGKKAIHRLGRRVRTWAGTEEK